MQIEKTKIDGAFVITRNRISDERGYFERVMCQNELMDHGLPAGFVQSNLSMNKRKGTLRGLHMQVNGYEEEKLVSCIKGRLWDVCVDLREDSKTFCTYIAEELSEDNGKMLYIPKGCAHGYLTLEDDTIALYYVTQFYTPNTEKGFRFDEPRFHIHWPVFEQYTISEKDKSWNYLT